MLITLLKQSAVEVMPCQIIELGCATGFATRLYFEAKKSMKPQILSLKNLQLYDTEITHFAMLEIF